MGQSNLTEERTFPVLLGFINEGLQDPIASGRVRVLGAGGASNMLSVVRALARDATSCVVFLDADEEGLREIERIRSSGLLLPKDVFRTPQRDGCLQTEFEDLFDRELYLTSINADLDLNLTVEEFDQAKQQTGGRRSRCGKWSQVMAQAANAKGLDWSEIADEAKASCAKAIVAAVQDRSLNEPIWLEALAGRVVRYLQEEVERPRV